MSNRTRLPLGDYYQLLLRHGLLADAAPLTADLTHPVSLVSCDSKLVIPNTLFVCKGVKFKEEYLRSAMEQGAFAYVSEREYPAVPLPCIRVTDIRKAMGLLADRAYGHPSGALRITGITGTKGKTTTAYYIKSIVDAWLAGQGHRESALLSTIVTDDGVERRPAKLTTPEPAGSPAPPLERGVGGGGLSDHGGVQPGPQVRPGDWGGAGLRGVSQYRGGPHLPGGAPGIWRTTSTPSC